MKKFAAVAASAMAAAALAAPAPASADPIDIGEICASLIGNNEGKIDLSPLVVVYYQTCENADLDGP